MHTSKMGSPGLRLLVLVLIVGLGAVSSVDAQVLYGSIVGTVQDPSDAVIPKASVTITNTATGVTRETTADDSGRYSIPNVLPGTYEAKVVAAGFRPFLRQGIDVTINTISRVDVQLEVGATTEAVTVAAQTVTLQTDKSDVHSEISTTAMTNLPLPMYRNYQSLINLVPGATPADFQNAVVDTPGRALATNVNGTAKNNNNTLVDGAANTFIWLPHHTYYVQPVESIETVNVSTGSFDAEQGMAGGAAITVATKSGTNDLHGTAFWYHNNQHLNGGPYFRAKTYVKPMSALNQGGGTIGGPIKKDKLFYFFSFEKTWERTGQSGNYSVAPDSWRTGDFSTFNPEGSLIYDPATQVGNDPSTRKPFANNRIPADRISPIFSAIQKQAPSPNQVSPTDTNNLSGNYSTSGTMKLDRNMYDLKMNYNVSQKLAVWGKYSRMDSPVTGLYVFGPLGGPSLGTDGFGDTNVNIPTVGFTYTISPTFLIDGVFGFTKFDQTVGIPGQDQNVGLDVWKIPGTNGGAQYASDKRYGGLPNITDFGFSNFGISATWAPLFRRERTYEYRTNFSKIHGAHELRWGFEPRRLQMDHWQPETANPRGEIHFSGGTTNHPSQTSRTANSYASALLGLVNRYNKSIQYLEMSTREWQLAWYVQDRWQASRNLTLNLGLRYEYYPLINRGERGIERWDPYTNTVYMGGLGNVPFNNGITVSKKLFAPRVGFAYRIGDKNVIRAGYGITYDPLPFSRPLRGLYPATLTGTWDPATSGSAFKDSSYGWYNTLTEGIPAIAAPDTSSGTLQLPLSYDMGPRSPWGGFLRRGYIQSWNLTVERRLPLDAVGTVAYVATRTIGQMLDRNVNTSGPGQDVNVMNRALAKLYGRTNAANMWDGMGYGAYNALQASLNKSFSKGLFLKGSYTWSKTMNMGDEDGWAGLALWSWEPMIARNYAPAGYDRTHMFTMAWVYDLPVGQGRKYSLGGIADNLIGGWKINGVFSAYSGLPFSSYGSGSSLRCNGCQQMADQIAPVKKIDHGRGPGQLYYDPNSLIDPKFYFDQTGVYRSGSTGRNALRGPGFWRLDPAIYKEFRITERVRTEFRAEAQNITNTPRWNNPTPHSYTPTRDPKTGEITKLNDFMTITGVAGNNFGGLVGRMFKFGLRTSF